MGNSCTVKTEEEGTNRIIGNVFKRERRELYHVVKILLLGTGESGKSTIFKQAKTLYGSGYSKKQLSAYRPIVFQSIILQFQKVLRYRKAANIDFELEENEQFEEFIFQLGTARNMLSFEPKIYHAIKSLWKDGGVKKCWAQRAKFQVFDCLEYFMSEEVLSRIQAAHNKYLPTFEDTLQIRDITSGIITAKLRMKDTPFELYDVGGQRTERKKWISCFDNVTTIIFVAAINEFDQALYENEGINRLEEALKVWEDIVNRSQFKKIGFVLFLNKWDLFKKKVCEKPYRVEGKRNEDYEGPDPRDFEDGSADQLKAIESCYEHTANKFNIRVDMSKRAGVLNSFPTVATDQVTMSKIFLSCQHQLLQNKLIGSGFGALTL